MAARMLKKNSKFAIYLYKVPTRADPPDTIQSLGLTLLLNRAGQGDREAADRAAELVYGELHRIASRQIRPERPGHVLQATALINEAYVRLAGSGSLEFQNRGHFFSIASRQMRRILVDYARAENAASRGGGATRVDLETVRLAAEGRSIEVRLLDQALQELARVDPRAAQVVELRYFGGYTDKEAVEAIGVSLATVRRDWEFAKAWLLDFMSGRVERSSPHVTGTASAGPRTV
jgi:RNA polymerase sigma factor (TIGR02999 family)